jgi:hypothetical protein
MLVGGFAVELGVFWILQWTIRYLARNPLPF